MVNFAAQEVFGGLYFFPFSFFLIFLHLADVGFDHILKLLGKLLGLIDGAGEGHGPAHGDRAAHHVVLALDHALGQAVPAARDLHHVV